MSKVETRMESPESDSGDDIEHYFLQPVKGYNILEKIKVANQQLFELDAPSERDVRVSFREELVDFFADDCSSDDGYGESGESATSNSEHEAKTDDGGAIEELEGSLGGMALCYGHETINTTSGGANEVEDEVEEEICQGFDDDPPCVCKAVEEENEMYEDDFCADCEAEEQDHQAQCQECDMVSRVVANLVMNEVVKAEQPKPEPKPTPPPKPKRPLFRSKFRGSTRFGHDENCTLEVEDTPNGRFRRCCKHKVEEIARLPRYQGANTLYGLSEDQWRRREDRLVRYEAKQLERYQRAQEERKERAEASESAFATWLKNKSRTSTTRTRNMFDSKRPRRPSVVQRVKKSRNEQQQQQQGD